MKANLTDWIVFSNIFIAACAVVMVAQTDQLILHTPSNQHYLWFVFFSSICSYNFHWWLTPQSVIRSPRIDWATRYRAIHLILFMIGLAGAAYFFFFLLPFWAGLLATAIATFLYSAPKIPHPWFRALRKVALGKTIFLSFIWMNVTTILPIWISGLSWNTEMWLFIISRYFMIYAVCILFDYRDREDDREAGVRSLVTFLTSRKIYILFFISIFIYAISTIALIFYGFPFYIVLVLLLPAILLLVLYRFATRHFSDFFYYVVLDGMMALPSIIGLIINAWIIG
jgi:4-hydroxybenzoate polyprenyltransferase